MNHYSARDRLIVALDVETAREARIIFHTLHSIVSTFKIGSQLFTASGPELVREIVSAGGKVFLDLKFHDIPNTVAAACVEASRLGVFMLNMHAFGGSEMMRRAADAVTETALKENFARPLLLAVTVLTSADDATLAEVCAAANVESQVTRLAKLAAASAMDGVVASPHEVAMVRASVAAKNFVIVTPGVRPANTATHDQRRVMTPLEAMRAQANFIVVGRAILNAPDRLRAAHDILVEMQQA